MSTEERSKRGSGSLSAKEVAKIGVAPRPRNWLVTATLLWLREANSYGYELIQRTAAFGFEAMNPGTLYRTLRHMEEDGLCESEWDTSSRGGPARRVYSITDAGEAYLGFWVEALEQYRRNVDAFFQIYRGAASTNGHEENKDRESQGEPETSPRRTPGGGNPDVAPNGRSQVEHSRCR